MFYVKIILSLLDKASDWLQRKEWIDAGERKAIASISLKVLEKVDKANEIRDDVTSTSDIADRLRDKADDSNR